MSGLLYAKEIPINNAISVNVPKVGEVLDNEETYFDIVSSIIATPFEMMAQLDNAGIDFRKITSFDLFCILLENIKEMDASLVLKGVDFKNIHPALNSTGEELVLIDTTNNTVIDRAIHALISKAICKILLIDRPEKKAANDESKEYLVAKAKRKLKRKQQEKKDCTELEDLIIDLVNTSEFKYDYETVKSISIFQFYSSLKQISHKIKFDNTMIGYYAGTIKFEDLSMSDRTWLRL